jgi:hypothetical protein
MKYNFTSKLQKFLYNKTLLKFIAGISFLNIIAFIMLNQTVAIIYFILIGLVTSFFSKNMNVVLLVPLILVNLFLAFSTSKRFFYKREGFKEGSQSDSTTSTNSKKTTNTSTTNTSQGLPITPLDHGNTQPQTHDSNEPEKNDSEHSQPVDEHFEVGRGKKNSKGYNIDYASTVEDAYDELNKILGSDGIKRLTSDTQNLMKQQLQLAESMKSMQPLIAGMGPLMQQAQGFLGSMSEKGNLGNLADIAKQFSASMPNK